MKSKKDIVGQALVNQGQKMVVRARIRTVLSVVLFCCGGVLLYLGLSGQQYSFTTFGIIFVLYALFIRFHVRRTKAMMTELEREVLKLTASGEKKQYNGPQPVVGLQEMTGRLKVSTKDVLPDEVATRVHRAVGFLSSHGITVLREQGNSSLEADIVIEVIEMGDISHEHIKPFLLTVFPKERQIKGITALLCDPKDDKQFEIPCDLGECIDWFRIK